MLVFGRLVQLVRILGRHPRGRGFEFLTAHQNICKSEKGNHGYDTANYYQALGVTLVNGILFARKKRKRG